MKQMLKFLASIALILLAIKFMDIDAVKKTISEGSSVSLVAAVLINMMTFLIMGIRWYWMISPQVRLPFSAHLAIYFKATFLNTFTPANLGGDAYRIAILKSKSVSIAELLKQLVRERLLGFYSYLIVFTLAWLWLDIPNRFNVSNPFAWGAILSLTAFIIPFIALSFKKLIKKMCLRIIGENCLRYLDVWIDAGAGLFLVRGMLKLLLISFVGILLWVMSIKVIAAGFGLSVPLASLTAVVTLVEIVRLVPLTIQGIGLREGAFAYLLGVLGHDPIQGYVVGAIGYLVLSISIVIAGPIGSLIEILAKKNKRASKII